MTENNTDYLPVKGSAITDDDDIVEGQKDFDSKDKSRFVIEENEEEDDEGERERFVQAPQMVRASSQQRLKPITDEENRSAKKRKYIYASISLLVALSSFVLQTETAGYLASTLKYKKPIFTLYLTHSSWSFMWPAQIIFLRFRKLKYPFSTFLRRHLESSYQTASIVVSSQSNDPTQSPVKYIIKVCMILYIALNLAGSSWYIAVNLTTPNDLTAIYNTSAFFAYVFSVPLLKEQLRWDKGIAVLFSIIGVIIVAYGGSGAQENASNSAYPHRIEGNIVIGIGAVLYGLYEVVYKRMASPPISVPPKKQISFANIVGSTLGCCTFLTLWIALPILHFTGVEVFELPTLYQALILFLSLLGNVLFSASFLILVSLTNPVLSSVASLLTTFLVPLVDFLLFGSKISGNDLLGGLLIIGAFLLLAYASWKEIQEENINPDEEEDEEDEHDEVMSETNNLNRLERGGM